MFSGKFRLLSICIDCHILCDIPKLFCLMKSKVPISDNSNFLASVKECITDSTIADTSPLKFPETWNLRSSSLPSCRQDHADRIKISGCGLYCKSIKTADSQHLCLYDTDTQGFCLSKSSLIKLPARNWLFQAIIILDLLRLFQCSDTVIYHKRIQISSRRIQSS